MATEGPGRAPQAPALTSLPRVEDLPVSERGYDQEKVSEAFDSFRRHTTQLQVQLRVLQAAGRTAQVEPTGHAVRMDALHLIRAAAEMADTIERDAQTASAAQLRRTEEEVRRRQHELQQREAEIERYRQESERQRAEIVNAAKAEARQLAADTQRQSSQELREAEARGARLLEQSRHQATELTNATRAEVEQTLEWARAQASAVLARAQQGAEQLLAAAGLGDDEIGRVVEAIVQAAEASTDASRAAGAPTRRGPEPEPPAAVRAPSAPAAAPPAPAQPPLSPPGPAAQPSQAPEPPPSPAAGERVERPASPPEQPPSSGPAEGASEAGSEGEDGRGNDR
jgi:F0F1-type ATP synthase membrane subunit b/b'